jgi:hypothetical protein
MQLPTAPNPMSADDISLPAFLHSQWCSIRSEYWRIQTSLRFLLLLYTCDFSLNGYYPPSTFILQALFLAAVCRSLANLDM